MADKPLEININMYDQAVKEYKKLLANKDKLVGQKSDDGRNQFQIKLNQLKKDIKRTSGGAFKWSDVKNNTLKQEREGKFDRGAEGKKKNKLRKKLFKDVDFSKGRHKDSDVDKSYERNMADADQDMLVEQIQKHTGTYKKKPKKGPNGGSR